MTEPTENTRRPPAATIADLLRYRLIVKQLPLTAALAKRDDRVRR